MKLKLLFKYYFLKLLNLYYRKVFKFKLKRNETWNSQLGELFRYYICERKDGYKEYRILPKFWEQPNDEKEITKREWEEWVVKYLGKIPLWNEPIRYKYKVNGIWYEETVPFVVNIPYGYEPVKGNKK